MPPARRPSSRPTRATGRRSSRPKATEMEDSMIQARMARSPRGWRLASLVVAVLLVAARVEAISIGYVQDFDPANALAHLNAAHGLNATVTPYTASQLPAITDFTVHEEWYVGPSLENDALGGPFAGNPVFQQGNAFGRVVITGSDPAWHIVNGGD